MTALACPYCYQIVDSRRLGHLCTGRGSPDRPGCSLRVDPQRRERTGYGLPARRFFSRSGRRGAAPRLAACPDCGGLSGLRACPDCHTPLPHGFGQAASPLVAMIGAKGAGKTVYLTVLAHELMGNLPRRFDVDVRLSGERHDVAGTSGNWVSSYVEAIFSERRLFPQTEAAGRSRREPVVFEWRAERRALLGARRTRSSYLSFYDTAGEDLLGQDAVRDLRYLSCADALVVMLDSFSLAGSVRPGGVPEGAVVCEEPALEVLTRVTQLLRRSRALGEGTRIPVPIAVVLTKIDAFFDLFGENHVVTRAAGTGPEYDEPAGRDLHEHLRALLADWAGADLDAYLSRHYTTYRYFAVSALGAEPDYRRNLVDSGGVRPHRVADPLLWLLSRCGVLPAGARR
jgi:hypothetical protein